MYFKTLLEMFARKVRHNHGYFTAEKRYKKSKNSDLTEIAPIPLLLFTANLLC